MLMVVVVVCGGVEVVCRGGVDVVDVVVDVDVVDDGAVEQALRAIGMLKLFEKSGGGVHEGLRSARAHVLSVLPPERPGRGNPE